MIMCITLINTQVNNKGANNNNNNNNNKKINNIK